MDMPVSSPRLLARTRYDAVLEVDGRSPLIGVRAFYQLPARPVLVGVDGGEWTSRFSVATCDQCDPPHLDVLCSCGIGATRTVEMLKALGYLEARHRPMIGAVALSGRVIVDIDTSGGLAECARASRAHLLALAAIGVREDVADGLAWPALERVAARYRVPLVATVDDVVEPAEPSSWEALEGILIRGLI